jgi:hypothetical protein
VANGFGTTVADDAEHENSKIARPSDGPRPDSAGRAEAASGSRFVDKLATRLEEACGVRISTATISSELRRMGYTHTR